MADPCESLRNASGCALTAPEDFPIYSQPACGAN